MKRLAIVASHVIQYQDPFFRRLAGDSGLDVTVFYCSRAGAEVYLDAEMGTALKWDIDLLRGYRYAFLRNAGRGNGYARLINPGVLPAIVLGRFDAVLLFVGWGTVTSLLAIAACRIAATPILLFGDSSFVPPEDGWRSRLRAAVLRGLMSISSGFMISGAWNALYYRHYGASPDRFFPLPWAIDNDRFMAGSSFAPGEREALRNRFGIRPDQVAFVYSGKLIARKDPMLLLRAAARMTERDRSVIVFLGHGELRDELEAFARRQGLNVRFAGFVNQTDLPRHYAMCDAFVLPSTDDPRATVTNEAMACGLPVVITDRCGPAGDIVVDGEDGFVVSPGDEIALTGALDMLMNDGIRARMSGRAREIIAEWNYERGVAGVKSALQALTKPGAVV